MTEIQTTRLNLSTGVTLKVALGGPEGAEPILFLHGFPESMRTWRHQLPALSDTFRVVAPNQRGYAGSDRPQALEEYRTDRIVEDVFALADALNIGRFTLVGHDWGGAAAWGAALKNPDDRVKRLVIINAPHPLVFQKSLIDDEAQRAASQYIRTFRSPLTEGGIAAMGYPAFFDKVLGSNADASMMPDAERQAYIDEWREPGAMTAMLNWYRASNIVVPEPGEKAHAPAWTHLPFPHVKMPTLVIWGMKDRALLPVQLSGLAEVVDDLRMVTVPDAGHFVTWERPEAVTSAIRDFISATS